MTTQTWKLDPAHSSIALAVKHMVIAKVRGSFTRWTADLALDPANLAASSIDVSIEAASIDTGVADRDAHLRSPDFLDAEKFPALRYRSRAVQVLSPDRLRVVGDLTIRNVTREVPLEVELGGQGKDPWGQLRIGFTARASLNRKEFGLAWNQALETGGLLVGEKVDVEIELQAIAQAAAKAG
jgi:polyisoprenoid-binding protein YceI